MFINRKIKVMKEGELLIHHNPDYPSQAPNRLGPKHSRKLQWVQCQINKQLHTIMNVHGLWNGQRKSDTPERIAQSQKIRAFMDTVKTPKILCGDFNLTPETESLKILKHEMIDLIELYKIPSTRTSCYPKRVEHSFADYVLTCPNITVKHFEALQDVVSDHAALLMEF